MAGRMFFSNSVYSLLYMSRKFLYRAWDKKYKVMLEGFAIYDEGDHLGMSDHDSGAFYTEEEIEMDMGGHFSSGDDWLFIMNDFELLQCTGLKDKNGELIFEGDILREPAKDDWGKINYSCFEVFFHDGDMNSDYNIGFSMGRCYHHGSVCGGYIHSFKPKTVSKMEIIGSIYSNPELLTTP